MPDYTGFRFKASPALQRTVGTLNNAGVPTTRVQKKAAPRPSVSKVVQQPTILGPGKPDSIKSGDTFNSPYLDTLRKSVKTSQNYISGSMGMLNTIAAAQRRLSGNLPGSDASHIGSNGANSVNVGMVSNVPGVAGQILNYGKQFLGTPYVFGASGPKNFDCSGFTQYVFKHFGINLPHKASIQAGVGQPVGGIGNAQPGDLITFNTSHGTNGHVGIYLGNGQFIHAPHTGDVVKISNLKGYNINQIRRVIG